MRKGLDVGLWSSVLDRRVVTARGHFLDILGNRLLSCPRHSRTYHGHPGRPPPGHARRTRSQGDLVGPAARARRRPRHPRLDVRHARGHRRLPVRRPAPPRGARAGGQRVGALRQGEARPLLPAHHRRPTAAEDRDGGVAALRADRHPPPHRHHAAGLTVHVPTWRRYLRFWPSDIDADLDEEFRFHVDAEMEYSGGSARSVGAGRGERVPAGRGIRGGAGAGAAGDADRPDDRDAGGLAFRRIPPTRFELRRVGMAGFECNGLRAGPLFYCPLLSRTDRILRHRAGTDRQTLRQTCSAIVVFSGSPPHSAANAVRGSTCDARRAGIHVAMTATRPTNAAAPANVDPSVVLTPYSIDDSTRVNAKAPASPTATPMATTRAPSPSKARTTLSGVAPSARRTPISRRRCPTMSATTPYKPTQANTSARTAKVAMSVMLKRCRASESPTTLSNVRISFSVADELTSCTAWRTSGSAASGSPPDTRTTSVSANAGNCESGTYTWGGASASNDTVFTSSTTPTMKIGRAHV